MFKSVSLSSVGIRISQICFPARRYSIRPDLDLVFTARRYANAVYAAIRDAPLYRELPSPCSMTVALSKPY